MAYLNTIEIHTVASKLGGRKLYAAHDWPKTVRVSKELFSMSGEDDLRFSDFGGSKAFEIRMENGSAIYKITDEKDDYIEGELTPIHVWNQPPEGIPPNG